MKFPLKIYFFIFLLSCPMMYGMSEKTWSKETIEKDIEAVLNELKTETQIIHESYAELNFDIKKQLSSINNQLLTEQKVNKQVALLILKDQLQEKLILNKKEEATDLSKLRYLKGLDITKILYEKILSLDHHFASIATFRDIDNLSNPNYYPEFKELKSMLSQNEPKKGGLDISNLLGNNVYVSVIHSFVSLMAPSGLSKKDKEKSLEEVECILDFTLQMHNDLSTIYFETVFLQKSNDKIMKDLEDLFHDYTKPIGYELSLPECRNNDGWTDIRSKLDVYMEKMKSMDLDVKGQESALKMRINIEFSIDRLLAFIIQYNDFIDQGGKFYEKFQIMLSSYENKKICGDKLSIGYEELQKSIDVAVDKFNTAYKPVEVNGSKMKEILYGINEYE
ncbi:MAG TPA: hypothetical protein VFM70_00270 [Salinimicrobium sp.]|nr:hypothetical protein [Salinimicrobium sp.]